MRFLWSDYFTRNTLTEIPSDWAQSLTCFYSLLFSSRSMLHHDFTFVINLCCRQCIIHQLRISVICPKFSKLISWNVTLESEEREEIMIIKIVTLQLKLSSIFQLIFLSVDNTFTGKVFLFYSAFPVCHSCLLSSCVPLISARHQTVGIINLPN